MKIILIPAAVAAVFSFAPLVASAQDSGDYTGAIITAIDPAAMTVTFAHGTTHNVLPAALHERLQPGARVDFHWKDINGKWVVTDVTPAS
ncbi:DUF1344 domain-containing protein [Solirhodobacter olei]|uniref:DUF1344 domain-containing protein n=1 Tax=Solirhodobacter olei TaxID=2493082 RepID=UPI0013E2C40B|nr:DUF1344 domain-containing protein [Solirhodobacter olei]